MPIVPMFVLEGTLGHICMWMRAVSRSDATRNSIFPDFDQCASRIPISKKSGPKVVESSTMVYHHKIKKESKEMPPKNDEGIKLDTTVE